MMYGIIGQRYVEAWGFSEDLCEDTCYWVGIRNHAPVVVP